MAFDVATAQDLARVLARSLTIDETDALVARIGIPDDSDPSRGRPVSKDKRLQDLFAEITDERCLEFIGAALTLYPAVYSGELDTLLASKIGIRVVGSRGSYSLVPTDSTPADPAFAAQETLTCLQGKGYGTAALHFRQAIENFADENWESANAQLRTTLEAVLEAEVLQRGGTPVRGRGQLVANAEKLGSTKLARRLDSDIVEHIKTLIKICHSDGSHPGAADEKEAEFRLVSVATLIRYITGC